MVRAKFTVQEIRNHSFGSGQTFVLRPQYSPEVPEDQRFSKATPSGELTMFVDNPPAQEFLKLGKTFYLDFSEVPEVTNAGSD